jgi:pantoate--beta-alanine ligase
MLAPTIARSRFGFAIIQGRRCAMRESGNIEEIRKLMRAWKREGLTIGLTPTMGFLHEGHESLMRAARKDCDRVVTSIFVNPMQFGPNEDLDHYPRDPDHDREVCEKNGVDCIFNPTPESMYPPEFHTSVNVAALTDGLCGASRPGHFRGVCTVVCKLFHIISPDRAYFGQKDAQQLAVIRRMTRDLDMDIAIVACPIVREADGLAKSSRNAYLSPEERRAALGLSRSLRLAEQAITQGERDSRAVTALIRGDLDNEPLVKPEYVEIVDALELRPLRQIAGQTLIALAARVGGARLIDNIMVTV